MNIDYRLRLERTPLIVAAVFLTSTAITTQAIAQDAGSLLQQLQPALPNRPAPTAPDLQVTPDVAVGPASSTSFLVKRIQITGNTTFPTGVLHALVADDEGRNFRLQELEALSQRLTAFYRHRGFILSRAIIPAQTLQNGVVIFQVVEASYGEVQLNNTSKVNNRLLASTLSRLRRGTPITGEKVDETLLLLSDVPGVRARALFKPGTDVGSADLDVITTAGDPLIASVNIDNYGNRFVGRPRLSGQLALNNPLHHGDLLSVSGVTSGRGLNFGQVNYDFLLNGSGTRAGAAFSALGYKLGREIKSLDAHGTARVVSAWLKQPLIRSRQFNIFGQLEFDGKSLRDRVEVGTIRNDRHLNEAVFSLNGDIRDSFGGGGISTWSASLLSGRTVFDNNVAKAADAALAKTNGHFWKWNVSASRLQNLGTGTSLYATIAAQGSDSNLDTAEKLTVGGPYSVRAYDIGALSGDSGYFSTIELRQDLGSLAGQHLRATAFFDTAHVKLNHRPWFAGDNGATLAGAGAGLLWEGTSGWHGSASVAARLGNEPSLVAPQAAVRAWVSLGKQF